MSDDPFQNFLDNFDVKAFEQRLPDACLARLRPLMGSGDPLRRLADMWPACTQLVFAARDLLDQGFTHDQERALEHVVKILKRGREKERAGGR